MTREEAIKVLNMVEAHGLADEAKRMAIKALEQEPCEDCISRAEAQKRISIRLYESALNTVDYDCKTSDVFKDIAEKLGTLISELPSIQPKPKTGRWEIIPKDEWDSSTAPHIKCTMCNHRPFGDVPFAFCPNCGAKMESEG